MKKVRLLLFSVMFFSFLIPLHVSAANQADVWDGSIKEPEKQVTIDDVKYYEISTAEELAYIAQTGGDWLTYNYILANDIVLNDVELTYNENGELTVDTDELKQWTPIGSSTNPFKGIFDGRGYTISGVYINSNDKYVGLFSYFYSITNGGVSNITVTNSHIQGNEYVGGISGYYKGADIENCYFDGAIIGKSAVGGIVGKSVLCNIYNCGNSGDIFANPPDNSVGGYIGGIVGWGQSSISYCYNKGNIFTNDKVNTVGGLAGSATSISYCYNEGNIFANGHVGGIVGNANYITYCYNEGIVQGSNNIGGYLWKHFWN